MSHSATARASRLLSRSDPLPCLLIGYLPGMLCALFAPVPAPLTPLPLRAALADLLPSLLWVLPVMAVAGLAGLPILARLPIFWHGFLYGYGSLQIYLATGGGALYFRYVSTAGSTLIFLCCLARLAISTASGKFPLRGSLRYDYLCRCLFYGGLILLSLPLRR